MSTDRPPPILIADHPGLDFLNTLAVPVDVEVEWLANGEDLLAWLRQAGLVPGHVRDALRKSAAARELDTVAAQARDLRNWFKPFVAKHAGKPLKSGTLRQLEPLNELLARDDEFGQIVVRDRLHPQENDANAASGLAWRAERRWRSPESLIFPLARSLADLVCTEDFTYVKACEGPTCTLVFLDRTRGHARRWCSMAVCGNRAKQAAYRERARE